MLKQSRTEPTRDGAAAEPGRSGSFLWYSCVSGALSGLRESALCSDVDVLHIRCSLLAARSADFLVYLFSFIRIYSHFPEYFVCRNFCQMGPDED